MTSVDTLDLVVFPIFNITRYILYIEMCLTTLQHTATHCNTLQHTATHCNTLQQVPRNTSKTQILPPGSCPMSVNGHATTRTLQHAATHCNTLQVPSNSFQEADLAPRQLCDVSEFVDQCSWYDF